MDYRLVLASGSPRRRQILQEAGFAFDVYQIKTPENLDQSRGLDQGLIQIAKEKAIGVRSILTHHKSVLILAADTVVVLNDQVIGKPKDAVDALQTLQKLSGQKHFVKTAFCVLFAETGKVCFEDVETSSVVFRTLPEKEIQDYIQTGDPFDKAGSYGIQSAGGKFVAEVHGSMKNVMGLPIETVVRLFEQRDIKIIP